MLVLTDFFPRSFFFLQRKKWFTHGNQSIAIHWNIPFRCLQGLLLSVFLSHLLYIIVPNRSHLRSSLIYVSSAKVFPFLAICLSFALHAISAVLKLLTSSYKLSASLQVLFPYCTLKLCHVLSSIAIRLLLVDVASLFLLYWTSNCQQKRVGDVCFCSKLFVCGEWVKCQRYQRLFSMCD